MSAPDLTIQTDGGSPVTGDQLNTYEQTCDNISQLRGFIGTQGIQVYVRGKTNPNDGGQGPFYWNATSTASDDNGATTVVPYGSTSGVWTRLVVSNAVSSQNGYNVKSYGATGNGTTDDTAAIQTTILTAGIGGTVIIPAGTYLVSSTLVALQNQQIIGSGVNSTIITRTGNFGDTLQIGTTSSHAGAAYVSGIWFNHSVVYTSGETSLPNLATSGVHVHIIQGQQATVENCVFWRMPYGIEFDDGSVLTVDTCRFYAIWDPVNAGCQEGIANIYINSSTLNCQLVTIRNCLIGGGSSASRTYTYICSDGNVNKTGAQSVGAKYGLYVTGCEGLDVSGSYFGGNSYFGVYAFLLSTSVNLEWRFRGNLFDGAGGPGGADMLFGSQSATVYVVGLTITGNTFNGEDYGQFAIVEANGISLSDPAFAFFSITGNTFYSYAGTPIVLEGANTGAVSDNIFYQYNALNIGSADINYVNAVTLNISPANIVLSGNVCGGTYAKGGIYNYGTGVNIFQEDTLFAGVTVAGMSLVGMVPDSGKTCLLGVLKSANFNTTGDQVIPIIVASGQKYVVTEVYVTNASTSLTTAAGGIYSGPGKTGSQLVASSQVYTNCTVAAALEKCTIAAAGLASTFTSNPLYLSLTTAQGFAATGDVYVRGVLLT